eukprot:152143_1
MIRFNRFVPFHRVSRRVVRRTVFTESTGNPQAHTHSMIPPHPSPGIFFPVWLGCAAAITTGFHLRGELNKAKLEEIAKSNPHAKEHLRLHDMVDELVGEPHEFVNNSQKIAHFMGLLRSRLGIVGDSQKLTYMAIMETVAASSRYYAERVFKEHPDVLKLLLLEVKADMKTGEIQKSTLHACVILQKCRKSRFLTNLMEETGCFTSDVQQFVGNVVQTPGSLMDRYWPINWYDNGWNPEKLWKSLTHFSLATLFSSFYSIVRFGLWTEGRGSGVKFSAILRHGGRFGLMAVVFSVASRCIYEEFMDPRLDEFCTTQLSGRKIPFAFESCNTFCWLAFPSLLSYVCCMRYPYTIAPCVAMQFFFQFVAK